MQLNQILDQRLHRIGRAQRSRHVAASFVLHSLLVLAFFVLPLLLREPPKPIDYVAVTVVPPKALGIKDPPPPTKEEPPKKQPVAPPPPPPKKEEPKKVEPERPVLVEKPKPKPQPPPPKPPPPKPKPAATKSPLAPASPFAAPPKRKGSPKGNPLGASTAEATLGVEDPNFTYGYYLDRIVSMISENWTRPNVGSDAKDAVLYFRIKRDGTLELLNLKRTSGNEIFDRTALAAVRATEPLPPLPKGYKRDFLGINLIVK